MNSDELIKLIAALGIGSGASAVITAVVAARSGRGKSRAEAADLLIGAAERVGKMNLEKDELLSKRDKVIEDLKVTVDEMQLSMFDYLSEAITREELLDRIRELRRSDNTNST